MTKRKERPQYAHIYPAGEKQCAKCGDSNKAGEDFRLFMSHPYWLKDLCADCYNYEEKKEKAAQAARYASGDEEPDDTDEITCPWCGHEMMDSWEMADDDEIECDECEKKYSYQRNVSVSYSSQRVEDDE